MTDDSQDLIVYVSYWMRFPGGSSSPPFRISRPRRALRSRKGYPQWPLRLQMEETKSNTHCNSKHCFSWEKTFPQLCSSKSFVRTNVNGMQIFTIHTCPVNSRSYFNNKRCVFTMKPSRPLVLPPGPQAGTGQAAHTLPCSNGRLHPSEREVCGDASAARPGRHVLAAPPEAVCRWWLSTFRNCTGPSTHVLLLWAPVNRAWIDLAAPRKVPDEAVISRSVQIHGPRRQ